jgi:hypothetical protein
MERANAAIISFFSSWLVYDLLFSKGTCSSHDDHFILCLLSVRRTIQEALYTSLSTPARITAYLLKERGKNIPESDEAYFRPV